MPSTVTTFAVFRSLLTRSIDLDANLDSATKAAMKSRVAQLARQQDIVLDQAKALAASGNASESAADRTLLMSGVAGTGRVEFDPMTFTVPLRVTGTFGPRGFLMGTSGTSVVAQIVATALSLQYRTATGDAWSNFDRSTVLDEVTWIQFAVDISTQVAPVSVPALHIHADQV